MVKDPAKEHQQNQDGVWSRVPEKSPKICKRCGGTGLVCGHVPTITPGSCCVDYANAICPDCKGNGKQPG